MTLHLYHVDEYNTWDDLDTAAVALHAYLSNIKQTDLPPQQLASPYGSTMTPPHGFLPGAAQASTKSQYDDLYTIVDWLRDLAYWEKWDAHETV